MDKTNENPFGPSNFVLKPNRKKVKATIIQPKQLSSPKPKKDK